MAKILLFEDDAYTSGIIVGFLEKAGHAVRTARNGKIGIDLFKAEASDLVIADIFMPEKDGLEVIRELRQETPKLPVIAISGGGSVPAGDALRIARILGAREVLSKPLFREDLLGAVERCLRTSD